MNMRVAVLLAGFALLAACQKTPEPKVFDGGSSGAAPAEKPAMSDTAPQQGR
jgi:hypothetical protein